MSNSTTKATVIFNTKEYRTILYFQKKQEVWLNYSGLCEVVSRLERWCFLKVGVELINARYGVESLEQFQVRHYNTLNPISIPRVATNRTNKDIVEFLVNKSDVSTVTDVEQVATVISEFLNRFFDCDQVVSSTVKPNLILTKLLEKHEAKIEQRILNKLQIIWRDGSVQKKLLGLCGCSKKSWSTLHAATCQGNKTYRMILPETIGKHQHRMPKLFLTYDVIKKEVEASYDIKSKFKQVTIQEMKEGTATTTQSQITIVQEASQVSSSFDSSQVVGKTKKHKAQPNNKKRKAARTVPDSTNNTPQTGFIRQKDSFEQLIT